MTALYFSLLPREGLRESKENILGRFVLLYICSLFLSLSPRAWIKYACVSPRRARQPREGQTLTSGCSRQAGGWVGNFRSTIVRFSEVPVIRFVTRFVWKRLGGGKHNRVLFLRYSFKQHPRCGKKMVNSAGKSQEIPKEITL